jgi:tRNA-splicing ligase RtcB (3'-phosphate/5'-hydroxy nucleic acid ligase)
MRVIHDPSRGQRVPVFAWSSALAPDTERQLTHLASQPWVVDHVAAMADAHVSDGVSVGTVFATAHEVVPSALGGDLGCGVRAIHLPRADALHDRRSLERALVAMARRIPVGHELHRGGRREVPPALFEAPLSTGALTHAREALSARHLGTLGGGNHFVELDRDAGGEFWLLVHSGSRGLGKAIADHHTRAALERAPPAPHTIAALDTREPAGRAWLDDVSWALDFARANREALASAALEVLNELTDAEPAATLDVHHNHVAVERHGDRELLVHRKGAMAALDGALGVIPGSMATASYIVRGLGCDAAWRSCSHGAGRVMTRREARDRVDARALDQRMRRVVYDRRRVRDLVEEAPEVYRDIREVLDDQRALITPVLRMEPVMVLKG